MVADHLIGEGAPCLVIAEAGINHNGDIEIAKKMVQEAARCGAGIVKFQTFTGASLLSSANDWGKIAGVDGKGEVNLSTFIDQIALSREAHRVLRDECRKRNVLFLSTAGTPEEVDFLDELGVQSFKIASCDVDNIPLLEHVARKKRPIILSTGMSTLDEVQRALDTIAQAGNRDVILLHCVSQYPLEAQHANLKAMDTLRKLFKVPVGFSDHSADNTLAIAAVARGACVIEKHFTLNKGMIGPDQSASADPAQLSALINAIRDVEKALGTGVISPAAPEERSKSVMRRSVVARQHIPLGATISQDMLAYKRPGTGISPADVKLVIGRQAKRDIAADELLRLEDV